MHPDDPLRPARVVRDRFGISDMTLWRWCRQGILPPPVKINKRNYWPESALRKVQREGQA